MPAVIAALTAMCTTTQDCNMNGVCDGKVCKCDSWWTGEKCSQLRLAPAKANSGYRTSSGANQSSWGGTIVQESTTRYSGFFSEWSRGCGLEYWSPNSRIIRATATAVDGPYVFAEVILPTFYTNPQIKVATDGTLLMYVIGQPCNRTADCTNASHSPSAPFHYTCRFHNDMQSGISLFSSKTGPGGPWLPHGMVLNGTGNANGGGFNNSRTNPAPLIEKDGSVKLLFRGGSKGYKAEFIGLATATRWDADYEVVSDKPLLPQNLE